MGPVGTLLTNVFYVVMAAATVFFVHRLAWFFAYRRLQHRLVGDALGALEDDAETTLVRWDQGAASSWSASAGVAATGDGSPADFVRRVEGRLERLERDLKASVTPLTRTFMQTLLGEHEPLYVTVLRIPRLSGPPRAVGLTLSFPSVPEPPLPPEDAFDLEVRSRYGFGRRVLAFFLGAADVVYSSQHVTRMAQNPTAPLGVLLRRLSLVGLVLFALAVDLGFDARSRLVAWGEEWTPRHIEVAELWKPYLGGAVGLGVWFGCYGALYVGLFLYLRWRSGRHLKALRDLREDYPERVAELRDEHEGALERWAEGYARTLDDATQLTMLQASMLAQRTAHRLRRRVASGRLLELADQVAGRFFERLPESSQHLEDVATAQEHTLRHWLWPRAEELDYQVELAKYRRAHRDLEAALSRLRGQHPDPELASQLWRSLVRDARMFPEVVPPGLFQELQEAHGASVATMVEETEADLDELDARLDELAASLAGTLETFAPLVESRVELTTRSLEASVADLHAEVLEVRERARLEAMAFEI
ncbi:MAG: hypothetical protein AAGH15_14515 [Myxococcota bacterium]